jgi:hypothetical protein
LFNIKRCDHTIQFPKPFDWFQQRLWRIYWIEWAAIFLIQAIVDKNLSGFDFITVPIAAGLMMTVVGKYIAKFYLGFTKLVGSIGGVGFFHVFADLLEALLMFVIGINYSLISRFSEEKLPENPLDKYAGKMGWE